MYKLLFIARNNMKKQKGDMITFVILTFISAFLIVNCFTVLLGLGKVLDTKFEDMNGAHVLFWVGNSESETAAAEKTFKENRHLSSYEITPKIFMDIDYKNADDDEFSSFEFIAEAFEETPSIMNVEKPDVSLAKNDILIPYNLITRFDIGDEMQIKTGDHIYRLNVAGYVEDPYFCSTLNISTHSVYMSREMIEALANEPKGTTAGFMYKGIADEDAVENGFTYQDLENEIGDEYKKNLEALGPGNEVTGAGYILLNWGVMKMGSKILPNIVMAVIAIFSILILFIALIIISFSIRNFIQKNMKNTGILEAGGYTVGELRMALTVQITITAVIGSVLGIVLAILVFSRMKDIYSMVVGLRWNQPINVLVVIGAFLGLVLLVFIVARLVSSAYKRISVLDALRGGISTHNYKKNLFSFEKTPLPISLVLSLKETIGGLGRTIIMVFIMLLLSAVTLVGFGMKENFSSNSDGLIKLIGFEMADMIVSGDEEIADELRADEKIENVFTQLWLEPNLTFNNMTAMHTTYAIDDMKKTTNTNVLEGRMPESGNELMVTAAIAEDFGLKVGYVVRLSQASGSAEYILVGINQRMDHYGRTIVITIDGAKRILKSDLHYSFYVFGKDGITYDGLLERINVLEDKLGVNLECVDLKRNMNDTIDTLSITMNMICGIITVLTVLIVIFVESLVIRAKLGREWKGMGISKALGETGFGLMGQIMLSNIPAIIIGSLLGALIAEKVGSVGCQVIFASFGIKKVDFGISGAAVLITIAGIALVALFSSALAGLKVRKLNPIELITEE